MMPNIGQMMQAVARLKQQYGANADPNQIIQELMNSGKVTQEQYDQAVSQAKSMFPNAHR